MNLRPCFITLILVLAGLSSACGEDPPPAAATVSAPRPVAVIRLSETDPTRGLRLTGSVESWTEQDIALDVSGFVDWVAESGSELAGRWVDDEGRAVVEGDVLARIDASRYRLRCRSVEAAVKVAKQELRAAKLAAERVLPANLAAAESNLRRAEEEYRRVARARADNAVSELELIRREADRDESRAKTEEVKAVLESKRAEVDAVRAKITELEQDLAAARLDVERCVLRAPFSGRVSKVYVQAGGFAAAATPVARLVMMDPLKVVVAVSNETASRVVIGDPVKVFIPGEKSPVLGEVDEKSTVADTATRTIRISVLIRNLQGHGRLNRDSGSLLLPEVSEVLRLERRFADDETSPWMVEERSCLQRDERGWFVWKVENLKAGQRVDPEKPVLRLIRVAVTPGERRVNFQGLYLYREIEEVAALDDASLIAGGVPAGLADGSKVVFAPHRWRVSPGETIELLLPEYTPSPGLWVPISALTPKSKGIGRVLVVDGGVARSIRVRTTGTVGVLWRIEAAQPEESALIAPGARVIAKDIHFLEDGEPVKVVETTEVRP